MEIADRYLDSLSRHRLEYLPWPSYDYRPEASFAIAHTGSDLLLKYFIKEKQVKVAHREINSPVHKDSCAEMFIGLEGEDRYYNYEFNCLGVCSAGFGDGRHGRDPLPEEIISKIKISAMVESVVETDIPLVHWQLTLIFPPEAFCFHQLTTWSNLACKGNFYKCGDDLNDPHFITWNPVEAAQPDFHRPEYFGSISFE